MAGQQNAQNWVPWAGLLITVGGIVYTAGSTTNKISSNEARISKLEAQVEVFQSINVRVARIEAKIDYIAPRAREVGADRQQ